MIGEAEEATTSQSWRLLDILLHLRAFEGFRHREFRLLNGDITKDYP